MNKLRRSHSCSEIDTIKKTFSKAAPDNFEDNFEWNEIYSPLIHDYWLAQDAISIKHKAGNNEPRDVGIPGVGDDSKKSADSKRP